MRNGPILEGDRADHADDRGGRFRLLPESRTPNTAPSRSVLTLGYQIRCKPAQRAESRRSAFRAIWHQIRTKGPEPNPTPNRIPNGSELKAVKYAVGKTQS